MSNISWRELTEKTQLHKIKAQWEELNQTQSFNKIFNSSSWIFSWLDTFWQEHWQLQVLTAWDNNKLIAIVPLYFQQKNAFSLRTFYPLGQGEAETAEISSEYLDILILDEHRDEIAPEVIQWLKDLRADQLIWRALLAESTASNLFQELNIRSKINTAARYFIKQKSWSTEQLSKNMRSRYRRGLNQIKKLDAKIGWVEKEHHDEYWQTMKEFHQERWRNKNKKGAFYSHDFNHFHNEFRKQLPENIVMSAIWVNDIPIAIHYYFADTSTLYFYQSGWNEKEYAKLSPGLLLHLWTISHNKASAYDFMMGAKHDSYKENFHTEQSSMHNVQIIYRPIKLSVIGILAKIKSLR